MERRLGGGLCGRIESELGSTTSVVIQKDRESARVQEQLACPGVQPPRGKRLARYQPRPVYQFVRRL